MTISTFGPSIPTVTLLLPSDGAFNEPVAIKSGWDDAPVIEFAADDTSWTAVIDPNDSTQALFTEARSTVQARSNGEAWLLRNVTTDEVIMQGRVQFQ